MHLSSITLCFVLVCNYISKVVVSETCLDVGHVNFTIRCNFEDCRIPGQFCDYSDEDFPRCANCDQDKCNEAIIPGECTIPCMKYRHTFDNLTKIIDKCEEDDTFYNRDKHVFECSLLVYKIRFLMKLYKEKETKDNAQMFFWFMVTSLSINGVLIAIIIIMVISDLRRSGRRTQIAQPVDDDQDTDKKFVLSTSNTEITNQKSHPC